MTCNKSVELGRGGDGRTERDTRVLLADSVTLVVGEEHVG